MWIIYDMALLFVRTLINPALDYDICNGIHEASPPTAPAAPRPPNSFAAPRNIHRLHHE